jgi:hypothetical protein
LVGLDRIALPELFPAPSSRCPSLSLPYRDGRTRSKPATRRTLSRAKSDLLREKRDKLLEKGPSTGALLKRLKLTRKGGEEKLSRFRSIPFGEAPQYHRWE